MHRRQIYVSYVFLAALLLFPNTMSIFSMYDIAFNHWIHCIQQIMLLLQNILLLLSIYFYKTKSTAYSILRFVLIIGRSWSMCGIKATTDNPWIFSVLLLFSNNNRYVPHLHHRIYYKSCHLISSSAIIIPSSVKCIHIPCWRFFD